MSPVRRGGAIAVVLVVGVVACTAATHTPTPRPRTSVGAPSGSPAPRDSGPPATTPAPLRAGLGGELDVLTIDPALTHPVLEFVSDGASIVFSSARAEDAGAEAAPDLWTYTPASNAVPELAWRNPDRDRSIVRIGGDLGTIAFVEIPTSGERAWNLWLIPEAGAPAILLDTHPGDEDVSSLVPSIAVYQPRIVWTAFDRGPDGPVSQLLMAEAPRWEPVVLAERRAADAELWLPSLYGSSLVFCEIQYSADRSSDERRVYLLDVSDPNADPRRLDTSGRATMPLIRDDDVAWKEADPGFSMFNWGTMFRYDLRTGEVSRMSTWPQEYVNYPSVGSRFVAWWGADSSQLGVYDLELGRAREVERHRGDPDRSLLRPHVAGNLLVWLDLDAAADRSQLRYAFLPGPGTDRGD